MVNQQQSVFRLGNPRVGWEYKSEVLLLAWQILPALNIPNKDTLQIYQLLVYLKGK